MAPPAGQGGRGSLPAMKQLKKNPTDDALKGVVQVKSLSWLNMDKQVLFRMHLLCFFLTPRFPYNNAAQLYMLEMRPRALLAPNVITNS